MNNTRRKELKKAAFLLGNIRFMIDSVRDAEEESYYNLPEGIQESERGMAMEDNVNSLETISDDIDNIISDIESLI